MKGVKWFGGKKLEPSVITHEGFAGITKDSYPSATGKELCVLLKPGEGELLTYVTSGQGEHWKRTTSVTRFCGR